MCTVRESGRLPLTETTCRRAGPQDGTAFYFLVLRLVKISLVKAFFKDFRQLIQQLVIVHFLQLFLPIFLNHLEDVVGLCL